MIKSRSLISPRADKLTIALKMPFILQERWTKFSNRVTIPQRETLWKNFVTLYSEENRHYHNLVHIEDCLTKLDEWPSQPSNTIRDAIELAIWFHDIVYDTQRADNEESSAALANHYLRGHPLATDCHALILATRHKQTEGMHAEEIMCDIDLSILGSEPKKYHDYAEKIRNEYSWVGITEYSEARARVLTNFLNRDNLFQTTYAIRKWELKARINLKKEREDLLNMI